MMRFACAARLAAVLLLAALPGIGWADGPPDEQRATTQPTSQPANEDLRQIVRELQGRLKALETKHAEERDQDRRRIAELEAQVAKLEDPELEAARMKAMRQQIDEVKAEIAHQGGPAPASQPSLTPTGGAEGELESLIAGAGPAPEAQAQPTGVMGTVQSAIQSMNPDISINGDFLASYRNHEGGHPQSKFEFRELELGFSGAVDPYTRADVIATVSHEDNEYTTDLEEAYLTFLQLPYGLQARVGKFRADFGRANPVHLHALPWVDYPFVLQRYFGEEGLSGTGGELSWLVPNPWDEYITLTYEIMNNDNDTLFAGEEADDITHLVHLKTFRDLSPASSLELGASFATGPNDHGHGSHRSMVEGTDLTYRWKPKEAGLYRSFLWQTELMGAQADIRGGQESTWGMYSAAEYQFARRWKFGLRYDNTELPFSSSHYERGYSAYLTFLQSEFLFWRLAYTYADRNFRDEDVGDEQRLMLQLNFTLGTHPAHSY